MRNGNRKPIKVADKFSPFIVAKAFGLKLPSDKGCALQPEGSIRDAALRDGAEWNWRLLPMARDKCTVNKKYRLVQDKYKCVRRGW